MPAGVVSRSHNAERRPVPEARSPSPAFSDFHDMRMCYTRRPDHLFKFNCMEARKHEEIRQQSSHYPNGPVWVSLVTNPVVFLKVASSNFEVPGIQRSADLPGVHCRRPIWLQRRLSRSSDSTKQEYGMEILRACHSRLQYSTIQRAATDMQ